MLKKIGSVVGSVIVILFFVGVWLYHDSYPSTGESKKKYIFDIPEEMRVEDMEAEEMEEEPYVETITPEELKELLSSQPVYVDKIGVLPAYLDSDSILSAIFCNNSGTDIRDVTIAYLAWDRNGLPLLLGYGYDGKTYETGCNYTGINMLDGSAFGEGTGVTVSDIAPADIGAVFAAVVSYTDFNGRTWENPYYETWSSMYSGIKLSR